MKEYNQREMGKPDLKIIIVGDTACGKTKLVERYLLDKYEQRQLSTYALTMFRQEKKIDGINYKIDIWDTAGQDQYKNLHPSYYFGADGCIMVFDVTRKKSYENLRNWYSMLKKYCPQVPVILVANKFDLKPGITKKKFKFAEKYKIPLIYTSAANGVNAVRVFEEIIQMSIENKLSGKEDFVKDVLDVLESDDDLEQLNQTHNLNIKNSNLNNKMKIFVQQMKAFTVLVILAVAKQSLQENCSSYQQAIAPNSNNPYAANFQANTAQYYSQAPAGQAQGKCNVIPCIGSPVFLIEKAHTYIDQQFDIANKYTSVRFFGYEQDTSRATLNHIVYKMVWEIEHYGGKKYVGVEVDSPIQGLGNATYNKFIVHGDIKLVQKILKMKDENVNCDINCGDQKHVYSYYNRGEDSQLPYQYAGKNFNTVQDALLDEIAKASKGNDKRQCKNSNYKRLFDRDENNFFRDETFDVTPPLRENFYCNAGGLSIDRIRIGCRILNEFEPDNLEAFQLIRKDEKSGSLIPGPVQGNTTIAERYFLDISLQGASEISIEFWGADKENPDDPVSREQLRITTYDSRSKQIDEIRCGEYFDHNLQGKVRLGVNDFLGFWYNFDGERNIQRLGVVRYKQL